MRAERAERAHCERDARNGVGQFRAYFLAIRTRSLFRSDRVYREFRTCSVETKRCPNTDGKWLEFEQRQSFDPPLLFHCVIEEFTICFGYLYIKLSRHHM